MKVLAEVLVAIMALFGVVVAHRVLSAQETTAKTGPRHLLEAGPVLVIVASRAASGDLKQNEVLVIRASEASIQWDAAHARRSPPKATGELPQPTSGEIDLVSIFESVSKLAGDAEKRLQTSVFFSLVLLDDNGTTLCQDLSVPQRKALRRALQPVFKDVLKNGAFAKLNLMLDILWEEDAPRAEAELTK